MCIIRVFLWAVFFSICSNFLNSGLCVAEGGVALMEGCLQTSLPEKGSPKGWVRADIDLSWGWARTVQHWNSGCWSFFSALRPAQSIWSVSCWLAVSGRELGRGQSCSASNNFTPAFLSRASVLCKKRGEKCRNARSTFKALHNLFHFTLKAELFSGKEIWLMRNM